MRKIKFRIIYLDAAEKKAHNGECSFWTASNPCCSLSHVIASSNYAVAQYTGLKDKNGQEIYEGDVLRYLGQSRFYDSVKIVVWENKTAFNGFLISKSTDYEIIGNIYENPELLKDNS